MIKYKSGWNKAEGESGGIIAGSAVARMTINLLTTSGITTSDPQKIAWSDGHKKMTFVGDEGKKYIVEFDEQNGLPETATVKAAGQGSSTAMSDGIIAYRYDPNFFEGKFPVEISRYYGNITNENAKAFTIRIQSLNISNRHLPSNDLDPDQLFKASNPNNRQLFYSNNVLYWNDAKGRVRRVLTVEENQKEIQRIKARQKQ